MRKSLLFLFCSLLLAACVATSGTTRDLSGAWVDEQEHLYFLDEDGTLGLPGQTAMSGVSWKLENGVLTLASMDSPGGEVLEKKLVLKESRAGNLTFTDADGATVTWKKSRARVGRLKGTLFYRERMALPPQVVVHVQLYPQHSSTPVAVSIMPASGSGEIGFCVYYLEQTTPASLRLAAAVLCSGETLFACDFSDGAYTAYSGDVSVSGEQTLVVTVRSGEGYNVIEIDIKERTVCVTDANCSSRKDCVHSPAITAAGGTIVCAPHRLVISAAGVSPDRPVVG